MHRHSKKQNKTWEHKVVPNKTHLDRVYGEDVSKAFICLHLECMKIVADLLPHTHDEHVVTTIAEVWKRKEAHVNRLDRQKSECIEQQQASKAQDENVRKDIRVIRNKLEEKVAEILDQWERQTLEES